MSEGSNEYSGAVRQLELQAMKSTFETRVAQDEKSLARADEILATIPAIAAELPPAEGAEPLTEAQKDAQKNVRLKMAEVARLAESVLYGELSGQELAQEEKADASYNFLDVKEEELDVLEAGGMITTEERIQHYKKLQETSLRVANVMKALVTILDQYSARIYRQ